MSGIDLAHQKTLFKQLGFDNDQGAALFVRATLLKILKAELERKQKKNGWTQTEAAARLGVKQPRISEIYQLRIDKFSTDLLIKYLSRLGKEVIISARDVKKSLETNNKKGGRK